MNRTIGRKRTCALTTALVLTTSTLLTTPAPASPVLVFECLVNQSQGLLPSGMAGTAFAIRRHVVDKPPDEEYVFEDWSLGRFSDNGRLELEFAQEGHAPQTERATAFRTALLDGRNGERDEVLEEALATAEASPADDFVVQSFVMVLADADGASFDSHLDYPDYLELPDFEQRECFVNWQAPAPAPCPGNPNIICDGGTQRGVITSFATEPHGPDDVHPFTINAGLNDAWVSAGAPLQGMFITVFEELGLVFIAWFTFDSAPPGAGAAAVFGAPDQRWVTAVGAYSGSQAVLKAELTTGGAFNAAEPVPSQDTEYGEITLDFEGCADGHVTFDFPSAGLSGGFDITRVLEDNVVLCEGQAAR